MSSMKELAKQNPGLISGWRLSVTLQLSTTLKWLLRHGEVKKGVEYPVEQVPSNLAMWTPIVKTWAQLGVALEESVRMMASAVGQIPVDGGDFLAFLIRYRWIVELLPIPDRERQIRRLKAEWPQYSHLIEQANKSAAAKRKRSRVTSYKRHLRRLGNR